MNMFDSHAIEKWQQQLEYINMRGIVFQFSNSTQLLEDSLFLEIEDKDKIISQCLINNSAQKLQKILGQEYRLISLDTTAGFDANYFSALGGTLKGGGILSIILCQSLSPKLSNLFQQKNRRKLTEALSSINIAETLKRFILACFWSQTTAMVSNGEFHARKVNITTAYDSNQAYAGQKEVINKIIRAANGHANRPLVITADRGRGKSAALGFASKELIKSHNKKIIITCPNELNLISFIRHSGYPLGVNKPASSENGTEVVFMPVDKIIAENPEGDLLIVDEAAAIPVTQLEQLTHIYKRIVLSTTTNGYEGNGKGFEIRFKQKLIQTKPQTRFAKLSLPMRWAEGDELEAASYQAFLLDTQLPDNALENLEKFKFQVIPKSTLIANNALLAKVFALLINAHYQTRPADLEQILSNQKLQVMALLNAEQALAAVALVNFEGNFDDNLCEQIYLAKKRLKGDLLPQSLIAHYGYKLAGQLKYYRIMRIAVDPRVQNQGVGGQLINHILAHAKRENIQIVGASFAADSRVIGFWLRNQFQVTRFGSAKDSSSGQFTCECFFSLCPPSVINVNSINARFVESFLYKLSNELQALDNQIVFKLLSASRHFRIDVLSNQQQQEIRLFCQGARSYSMVDWLLFKYFIFHITTKTHLNFGKDFSLLIDSCVKQITPQKLIEKHALTGKKQLASRLRQACFEFFFAG